MQLFLSLSDSSASIKSIVQRLFGDTKTGDDNGVV